ncbi:hypothetical protein B0H66DRAFT_641876 [Apodospora peruviana]|uniref:Secreted protein n=1 Tax=Apodospora peruviana TaxID=516989 RepID=A0AAE0M0E9_9PEZI|nr:hypothetical protein B0H66DRAFT_641876 [Apodospora peruviana]
MLRIAIFVMAFLAVQVLGLSAPIPGYTVEDFTWRVDPFNNGTMVNITGTVEQVYDELAKVNPGRFSPDAVNNITAFSKRGVDNKELYYVHCGDQGWGWQPAWKDQIEIGVRYLMGVSGAPTQGPGPGSCGRVSCSEKSAIWWCNDNKVSWTLPGFSTIATCAHILIDTCADHGEIKVVGQNFHTDNWNCIVREDYDHC